MGNQIIITGWYQLFRSQIHENLFIHPTHKTSSRQGQGENFLHGCITGCFAEILIFMYKTFIRLLISYFLRRMTSIPIITSNSIAFCGKAILRKCRYLHYRHPSSKLHQMEQLPTITAFLCRLFQRLAELDHWSSHHLHLTKEDAEQEIVIHHQPLFRTWRPYQMTCRIS